MGIKFEDCKDRQDCFANKNGRCICLTDTKSYMDKCPFYKTSDAARAERMDGYNKLFSEGRVDLIEKYHVKEQMLRCD